MCIMVKCVNILLKFGNMHLCGYSAFIVKKAFRWMVWRNISVFGSNSVEGMNVDIMEKKESVY